MEYDQKGIEIARQHRVIEAEANSLINLGHDCTNSGQGDSARSAFRGVEDIFERDKWNRWRFYDIRFQALTSEYCLAGGNLDQAEVHAEQLLVNATRHEVPKYIAV